MKCPGCGQAELEIFFRVESAPVFCNVLLDTRREALAAPRAAIHLGVCPHCALIYNAAFKPELVEYAPTYENSLHYSPQFQQYAVGLARQLVENRRLYGKDIIEIGCGRGDFLAMLCRIGGNRGIGFDPSHDASAASLHPDVTIRPEPFSRRHRHCRIDFVCCRQVLEHIPDPLNFLQEVRYTLGAGGAEVFFEVPHALYTLKSMGIWDVLYEHCSYFSKPSLTELFCRSGFVPVSMAETFGGQFLTLEATLAEGPAVAENAGSTRKEVQQYAMAFDQAYQAKLAHWREAIERIRTSGRPTVVWGAGTKGTTFLNSLEISDAVIPFIADLNPRKHGRFIPGTGQRVVPPAFLQERPPQTVIVMNPNYIAEIQGMLAQMGIAAEVLPA